MLNKLLAPLRSDMTVRRRRPRFAADAVAAETGSAIGRASDVDGARAPAGRPRRDSMEAARRLSVHLDPLNVIAEQAPRTHPALPLRTAPTAFSLNRRPDRQPTQPTPPPLVPSLSPLLPLTGPTDAVGAGVDSPLPYVEFSPRPERSPSAATATAATEVESDSDDLEVVALDDGSVTEQCVIRVCNSLVSLSCVVSVCRPKVSVRDRLRVFIMNLLLLIAGELDKSGTWLWLLHPLVLS